MLNLSIDNEDVIIIHNPHPTSSNVGLIWSADKNFTTIGHKYVGQLQLSIPLTDFERVRTLSSRLDVVSNTISTTSTVLSGLLTGVSLGALPAALPSYS